MSDGNETSMLARLIAFVFVSLIALVLGCGGHQSVAPSADAQMTLYSLDPKSDFPQPNHEKPKGETFHRFDVLGKIENVDAAKRKELVAALDRAVANSDGNMAKCFEPRHGIRMKKGDSVSDYVICFECLQMAVHQNGSVVTKAITQEPVAVFNKHLTDAGIRIAPPKWGKD